METEIITILERQYLYQKIMNNQITLDEFKDICKYLIKNNFRLADEGKPCISIGLEGSCGLGKTSILEGIADELGMTYVRLGLSELEEVSDLTGFPIKEYEVTFDDCPGCPKWVASDILNNIHKPFDFTGASRMSYATPSWLPREENENGILLNIDDFTRANSLFQQALMELINKGKYISWNLPSKTIIALTSNPDNGLYTVTSLDPAQRTRFINFPVKFDISNWSQWAENAQVDGRAINFALSYSSELFEDEKHLETINPRSYTMFANAISGITDWQKPESLALILNISKGCFNDPDNVVGSLFTTFVANNLDKLVSPKDMLLEKWDTVYPKIKKCVYDSNGNYKPSVGAILNTRLLNYSMYYFDHKGETKVVYDRLLEILNANEMLFSEDLVFHIVRTLCSKYQSRCNKWMLNNRLRGAIIG